MLVKDAARLAAAKLLAERWDGSFPVDPVELADRLDIEVKSAIFKDPDTSGAIIAQSSDDVTIYFARDDDHGRQTFTVAHELGHYFDRQAADDPEFSFVETRHPDNYTLHEFYADEFAGNLLMPTAAFCDLWDQGLGIRNLADYFGVTSSAVRKRLDRLRKYGDVK